jgi:hypothetical protein
MTDIISLLDDPATTVAVVGATDDRSKYGNRIYRDLKNKGFRVFAVNPKRDTVEGDPAFTSLDDLPEHPTIVDYVVPPPATLEILEQARRLGLLNAWIQPGAEDPAVLEYLEEHGFTYLANACIMVESRAVA